MRGGDYDGALNSYKKALDLRESIGEQRGVGLSHYSIGMFYIARGIEQEGALHLQKSLRIASGIGDQNMQAAALIALGQLMRNAAPDKAIKSLCEALSIAEQLGAKGKIYQANELLSQTYKERGDFEKAFKHHQEFHRVKSLVFNEESDKRIRNLQITHEVGRLRAEAEIQKLNNDKLKLSLERKTSELTTLALQLAEKNQLLGELKKTLGKLQAAGETHEAQDAAESALRRIERNIQANTDWKRFDEMFNQLNQSFMQSLASCCPKLSPSELKIATLMKMGLASKEIAGLLSVSTRTVENHRLQIRKKLKLKTKTNVVSYLASL